MNADGERGRQHPTSSAITKNLIQHIQLVTEFEPDLSPILSPKNYLMLPLTRAQLGTESVRDT